MSESASNGARGAPAVFSTNAGQALVGEICRCLGVAPARYEERAFEDGEHKLRPLESVRGRDVYLVEALHGGPGASVNDRLVRALFFIGALKDAGAARVTMVAPYLCYARKDTRTKPRDPVSTRYLAALLESVRTDRVVVIDVHNRSAYENAFRIPAEHLSAALTFVEWFVPLLAAREAVVVSPDAGGVKRAERFRQALERRLGQAVPLAFMEKFRSEGQVRGGTIIGSVGGRVAILIDDLISSGKTLAMAAAACRQAGALAVYAAATHGVFAPEAWDVLGGSQLEQTVILDTIERSARDERAAPARVVALPCAPLLAAAIDRLHGDGSLVELEERGLVP